MNIQEIREKYGDVKLKFKSYYKYSFAFEGKTSSGEEVYASVGGTSDDIYKLDVSVEREETINSLYPNYITVSKDGKEIVSWNDWLTLEK